ncbi:MAG TPA: S-layer homology domain-containing protein, partial [Bacillota bacterium]|nr:S-layer homology domain-containing protein [Bacillota bacterium]
MKRTVAMLIAVLLAMAVAMPAMASPYPDVPDYHWATESIKELTALGIFEGYPDGTFKGPQATTRYELAVVIARLLKWLDERIVAHVAAATPVTVTTTPVPTPAPVTTVVKVEPDQTILEQIIKEKIEAQVGPKLEDIDARIAELYAMIQDLRTEFSRELSILGVRVDALDEQFKKLEARVAKNEADIAALKLQLGSMNNDALASKLNAVESKVNTVDNRVGVLELKASETDAKLGTLDWQVGQNTADLDAMKKQVGQNTADIVDLYSLNYKNADDINALKAEMAAKFAAIEATIKALPAPAATASSTPAPVVVPGTDVTKEEIALLRLDLLEAQDDITKLKALYDQVNYLYECCEAANAKMALLDEKIALLNLDLASLESGKVDNALMRIGLLEQQAANLGLLGPLQDQITQNANDINDLYIQQNHDTNLLKNLAAADAALNERIAALEASNKISADALSAKVASLEGAAGTSAADVLSLKSGLMGLTDKLASLWVNKFLLSGTFAVEFKDTEVKFGPAYKDPYNSAKGTIDPSNLYKASLTLNGTIKPEPGVEINVGLTGGVDTYGIADVAAYVFNGDLDVKVTGPNGSGQILGGEQSRPKYISKYVMSDKKFTAAGYEGLSGWMKYTPTLVEDMTLGASAILAKLGSTTDFNYVWGLAGNANYAEIVDLTLHYLAVDDRLFSGDTTVSTKEKNIGVNLDLTLNENWSAGGFANLVFQAAPMPEQAITAYLDGKVGIWSTGMSFERVSAGYAPQFAEFADGTDPDIISSDVMNVDIYNKFQVLPNLEFGLLTGFYGDAAWANMTHTNEIYAKYSFEVAGLTKGSLKLYGGRQADTIIGGTWQAPASVADAFCYAGADLKLKLYIFDAGFSYYGETEKAPGMALRNTYLAFLKLEKLQLIQDVLWANAGWEGRFGDTFTSERLGSIAPYQMIYGDLHLNTSFFLKWNLAANLGAYFKSIEMLKVFADMKLTYNITEKASLYAMGGVEYRNYVDGTKPDGFVLSAGVGYNQKIFNNTSLVADFTTRYAKYTNAVYPDSLVNTLGVKLST